MPRSRKKPTEEHTDYIRTARALAEFLYIDRGEPITIDDVTDNMPLPDGMGYQVLGSIFKTPRWRHVGYRDSRDRSNGRRAISCFELIEEAVDDSKSIPE